MKSFSFTKKVIQIMSPLPPQVPMTVSLGQLAAQMEEARSSSLLVTDADKLLGIVTERDVVRALGQDKAPEVPVSDFMSRHLISVKMHDEVQAAFHQMVLNDIRHLLVVDEQDEPVGFLSESNFHAHRCVDDMDRVVTVGEVMSQGYLPAQATDTIQQTAHRLQANKFGCAVVLHDNVPQGLVTERDMVRFFHQQMSHTELAAVMTQPVLHVREHDNLETAIAMIRECRVRRLVVVNAHGRIVGVLNERDILRFMEDGYVQLLQQLVRQQAQALNNNLFSTAINNLPDMILLKDLESRYVACNESYRKDHSSLGVDIIGKTDFEILPPEQAQLSRAEDLEVMQSGIPITREVCSLHDRHKHWRYISKTPMRDVQGNIIGLMLCERDITHSKQAEIELQRRGWTLKALSDSNQAIVMARSRSAMLRGVCDSIAYSGTYVLAWIGWAENDADKTVRIAASAGNASRYLDGLQLSWADQPSGREPTGTAIRNGRTIINRNLSHNPTFSLWRERAEQHGIKSSIAVPILIEGTVSGALMVYASDETAFGAEEVHLLEDLANNLGYGLSSLLTQQKFDRSLIEKEMQAHKLDAALEGALIAVASTLEQRDPYTAGHQKEVAELAVMIGQRMGLDQNRLRGLHLAGIVHDLGKIQIPAEILTKPGRLNLVEFNLIKLHPEVGYEILKNIDFPWPIAQIVRQHHEYLDGSGYPLGLHAEQILLEAKILSVADIVESMSSDRPYRAALGLDVAIREIQKLSGIKLDPDAVSACVGLLESGLYLPTTRTS